VQHQFDKTTDRKIWHHVAIEHCELLTMNLTVLLLALEALLEN
jgi:hypothetical protein